MLGRTWWISLKSDIPIVMRDTYLHGVGTWKVEKALSLDQNNENFPSYNFMTLDCLHCSLGIDFSAQWGRLNLAVVQGFSENV